MSNILDTTKELKKKLSFNDYSTSTKQQASVEASNTNITTENQHAIMQESHNVPLQARQHDGKSLQSCDGIELKQQHSKMTGNQDDMQVSSYTGTTAQNHAAKPISSLAAKKKVTFYLSDEDDVSLTNIYIKRLQARTKTDKSALIAEAIKLLVKKENKI